MAQQNLVEINPPPLRGKVFTHNYIHQKTTPLTLMRRWGSNILSKTEKNEKKMRQGGRDAAAVVAVPLLLTYSLSPLSLSSSLPCPLRKLLLAAAVGVRWWYLVIASSRPSSLRCCRLYSHPRLLLPTLRAVAHSSSWPSLYCHCCRSSHRRMVPVLAEVVVGAGSLGHYMCSDIEGIRVIAVTGVKT